MSIQDKRLEKGEETYRRVIQAALEIISEHGVSGITASRLSERAGISKSSIFHHFPSTQDIPGAVLKAIMETMVRAFEPNQAATSLEHYLLSLGEAVCHMSEVHRLVNKAFFSFYHESMFNEGLRVQMTAFLQASVADLKRVLLQQTCVGGAEAASETAETIGYLILSTLDGIGLHLMMGESTMFYQRAWTLQVEWIVRYFNENYKNS